MKINLTKEQCMRLARAEGDSEVGAGPLAATPGIDQCPTCSSFHKKQVPPILRFPGEPECPDLWHQRR